MGTATGVAGALSPGVRSAKAGGYVGHASTSRSGKKSRTDRGDADRPAATGSARDLLDLVYDPTELVVDGVTQRFDAGFWTIAALVEVVGGAFCIAGEVIGNPGSVTGGVSGWW